jgi:pimeloyl-ACP methyl ester carboxylesterase
MIERPLSADQTKHGVVLLHGISRTSRSFNKMQAAIEASGFATLNLDYPSRRKSLQALAEDIHPAVARFAESIEGSLHFVCHSMGGLLARVYLARHRPKRLGRVVMLGTPNGGSEIADRLKGFAAYRAFFGPAGQQLGTRRDDALSAILPPVDYPVGIIRAAGRSIRSRQHSCRSRMTVGCRWRTQNSTAWPIMSWSPRRIHGWCGTVWRSSRRLVF